MGTGHKIGDATEARNAPAPHSASETESPLRVPSSPPDTLARMSTIRHRGGWQPLADIQLPYGIVWIILLALRVRQRRMDRAVKEFSKASSQLGTFLGDRMRERDERDRRLLDLQVSVERLTRWLVVLTVVLGLLGIAGVSVSVWAIVR